MDGTIGEIRLFAANFAPYGWMYCAGQLLPVRANTALFAILGTTYGGDGIANFALPDFQGRAAVCAGQGPGLYDYALGEKEGVESVALLQSQMPMHIHMATATNGPVSGGQITLNAINGVGGEMNPGGNFIGEDSGNGLTSYAASGSTVSMDSRSISISNVTGSGTPPSVTLQTAGGNAAHNNMQPFLVLNYVICLFGDFPMRN